MPAITIRNIPEETHRGLKALAAQHGRSTEAEVRDLIARAVRPDANLGTGQALLAIWRPLTLTEQEHTIIESARDRVPAEPMSFDE